jgi:hypothetical protein
MKKNKNIIQSLFLMVMAFIIMSGCQKLSRPALGDYPKDANPPGGPLKFFAAFDGTGTNPLMNAVDSIRANFPADNPFASIAGVTGKGVQGNGAKAIRYPSANDFGGVTSCTIAMWLNNVPNTNTEFLYSLASPDFGTSSASFVLIEHATPTKCQLKFYLMDQWVEFNDNFNKPLFDGNWHHLAFTYNEKDSLLKVYFDGAQVPIPGSTGNLGLGKLDLKHSTNLVVGGWNKQAGITGWGDDWIKGFSGKMDQFRLYGKALTNTEILALYNSKQ